MGVVTALCTMSLEPLLDSDPLTRPDWDLFFMNLGPSIGLLFARDDQVTSEEAGAK